MLRVNVQAFRYGQGEVSLFTPTRLALFPSLSTPLCGGMEVEDQSGSMESRELCTRHTFHLLELSLKISQRGTKSWVDPSLIKHSTKNPLAHNVLEHVLKVGCKFWNLFFPPLKL